MSQITDWEKLEVWLGKPLDDAARELVTRRVAGLTRFSQNMEGMPKEKNRRTMRRRVESLAKLTDEKICERYQQSRGTLRAVWQEALLKTHRAYLSEPTAQQLMESVPAIEIAETSGRRPLGRQWACAEEFNRLWVECGGDPDAKCWAYGEHLTPRLAWVCRLLDVIRGKKETTSEKETTPEKEITSEKETTPEKEITPEHVLIMLGKKRRGGKTDGVMPKYVQPQEPLILWGLQQIK